MHGKECTPEEISLLKPMSADGWTLCKDLTYLGFAGIRNISGLRVGWLSGGYDSSVYELSKTATGRVEAPLTTYLSRHVNLLVESSEDVDILLTSEWPHGMFTGVPESLVPDGVGHVKHLGSGPIAQLAKALQPRYHFACNPSTHYERLPYFNHRTPTRFTRFISLASYGNEANAKALYATTVVSDPGTVPAGTTPFPFEELLPRTEKPPEEAQARPPPTKRHRGPKPTGPCWFCLGGPDVATHLIVTVGTDAYIALPKGGIVDDHVLVIPVAHLQSLASSPQPVVDEIFKHLDALRKFYESQKKKMVWFERFAYSRTGVHMIIQVVPVPEALAGQAMQHFVELGGKCGAPLEVLPPDIPLSTAAPSHFYFYAEMPDGTGLIHHIQPNERHPVQFGRLACATILGHPDREDWKQCAVGQDDETHQTDAFREAFAKFAL